MAMRMLICGDEAATTDLIARAAGLIGAECRVLADSLALATVVAETLPQVLVLDVPVVTLASQGVLRRLAASQFSGLIVLVARGDAAALASTRGLAHSLGLRLDGILEKPLRLASVHQVLSRLALATETLTVNRLRQALARDEMRLDFQPIVSRAPKTLRRLEALIRWEHPVLGVISPADFLPLAESDIGTIDDLAAWVVGAAAEAYQVLGQVGLSVPISINLSGQNLQDPGLPDRLEASLRAGFMPTSALHIEITESAAFGYAALTVGVVKRLRDKGFSLSIDNFGTGGASFKLLCQMAFSEIKIDQSFVSELTCSHEARMIVKSMGDLATNLALECVGEGVESDETASLLEAMGVTQLQGFFIARPMPVEAVASWWAIWSGAEPSRAVTAIQSRPSLVGVPAAHAPESPVTVTYAVARTGTEPPHLPPRQLQVMELLAEGCGVKEIARRLDLGVGTVKVHLSLAYSALGARNRVEAIRRAYPLLRPTG